MSLNEKAAGTRCRVVDLVSSFRLGELYQQPDDLGGGIEFAAFLPRAVGKELDQVFIGCSQQVGKLEIVVDQDKLGLVEVVEQILPLLVGNLGLAFDGIEINVIFKNPGQGIVFIFNGGDGLIEHIAYVVLKMFKRWDLITVFVDP